MQTLRVVWFGLIIEGGAPVSIVEPVADRSEGHLFAVEGTTVWAYWDDYRYLPRQTRPIPCDELSDDRPWGDTWTRYLAGQIDLSEFLDENYAHDRSVGVWWPDPDGGPQWTNERRQCWYEDPDRGLSRRWFETVAPARWWWRWCAMFHSERVVLALHKGHRYSIRLGGADIVEDWAFNPADLNLDGAGDTQDLLLFLSAFSTGHPIADVDADGTVTSGDILLYFELFEGR